MRVYPILCIIQRTLFYWFIAFSQYLYVASSIMQIIKVSVQRRELIYSKSNSQ